MIARIIRETGNKALDWSYLCRKFPRHKEHICRIRNSQEQLLKLAQRLVKVYGQS